jgi:glyoxylase-like metal-dependent hydrolase (beta-lactamase superfamily II)
MAMKIIPLLKNDKKYSCYSYLILGDWNRIEDINTIIDPGIDDFVVNEIERLSTGFGKVPVAQIILTHNHFDHAQSVQTIKAKYQARVLAFSEGPGVDELLTDGQIVKAGDDILEVLHTPGHSSDSICLYSPSEKALFSGDTQLRTTAPECRYAPEYTEALIKIACRDVQRIYSGHDEPMKSGCQEMIFKTLGNVKKSEHISKKVQEADVIYR